MKPKLILGLALVFGGGLLGVTQTQPADAKDTTQALLERMATNYSHFSLETVIKNRAVRLWGVRTEPPPGASGPFRPEASSAGGGTNPAAAGAVQFGWRPPGAGGPVETS